jgi:Ca-activated chloride channel family protein
MSVQLQALWPLAFASLVPLALGVMRSSRRNLSRRHMAVLSGVRAAVIVLLVLAACRPIWRHSSDALSLVFALDVSRSVSPTFVVRALDWIERIYAQSKPAHARVVVFAGRPVTVENAQQARVLTVADSAAARAGIARNATDLERALDASLVALERDKVKRIVLLSDGNQTEGDVWRVLPRLKEAGVRVYPVPAVVRDEADVWVDAIEVPEDIRDREPIAITVRVFSPRAAEGSVALMRGPLTLGTKLLRLHAGMNSVRFEARLPGPGVSVLSARASIPGDSVNENDRVQRAVWVGARPRALYVEGGLDAAPWLPEALRSEGIRVEPRPASSVPAEPAALAQYDAMILSDVPAKALTTEQMRALESYVRDLGGGLLFAAGENTFGEEGYAGTPVERILPVEFKAQDKRRDLALVIAIDRSYSMKGRKMEYAKEAARAALDLLEEQHRFAVVAFDSQPHLSVPLQQVRSKKRAEDLIGRIQASGQTNIYPALGMAYRILQQVESKAKHVILLSDGDTHPADFERLVGRMKAAGIVLSTVTIGESGDPKLMEDIARWGGGRSYLATSAEAIPQILVEETRKTVRENLTEQPVRAVVTRRLAALSGIDFSAAPTLRGHVATRPRDTAEVALATDKDAPLLVRWQYGLGKSVMFASDVKNRWAAEWLQWKDYGKFWAQLVRDTMRREGRGALDLRAARQGREALITLSVLDEAGRFRNGLSPRVRVAPADPGRDLVALEQTGPGWYSARIPLPDARPLVVQLVAGGGLSAAAALRTGPAAVDSAFEAELRSLPPDLALLETIARETGAALAPRIEDVFEARGDRGVQLRPLWPWLLAAALLLYLGDLFVRRAPLAWRLLGS